MNAEQYALAAAVIEATEFLCEAHLTRPAYPGERGDTHGHVGCAIGRLALSAGHTVLDLYGVGNADSRDYPTRLPRLVTVYGLDADACEQIVDANDDPQMVLHPVDAAACVIDYDDVDADGCPTKPVYDWPRLRKAAVLQVLASLVHAEATAEVPA